MQNRRDFGESFSHLFCFTLSNETFSTCHKEMTAGNQVGGLLLDEFDNGYAMLLQWQELIENVS